jgi:hypothetical protein
LANHAILPFYLSPERAIRPEKGERGDYDDGDDQEKIALVFTKKLEH